MALAKTVSPKSLGKNIQVSDSKKQIGLGCRYKHVFADGCYIREMFIPKGLMIVSEVHKTKHPYFVMYGKVSVKDQSGNMTLIEGPYSGITEPWTQRALLTHEDTLWITVHITDKKDIEEIGKDILATKEDLENLPDSGGEFICLGHQ